MQAALCDLAPTRVSNPQSFVICQRILLQCHEIIFGDPPPPSRPIALSPYVNSHSTLSSATLTKALSGMRNLLAGDKKLVPGHLSAAMVGMGVVLASTPGIVGLTETVGKVAIEQGRVDLSSQEVTPGKVEVEPLDSAPRGLRRDEVLEAIVQEALGHEQVDEDGDDSDDGSSPSASDAWRGKSRVVSGSSSAVRTPPNAHPSSFEPDTDIESVERASQRDPSATVPSLPIAPHLLRQNTHDPFDQFLPKKAKMVASPRKTLNPASQSSAAKASAPSRSVPSFSASLREDSRLNRRAGEGRSSHDAVNTPEALLSLYSPSDQTRLLRSHYCRSEVRFLIALEDISNRLLVIPKPARVSALRAELTSLNHLLPAEVRLV